VRLEIRTPEVVLIISCSHFSVSGPWVVSMPPSLLWEKNGERGAGGGCVLLARTLPTWEMKTHPGTSLSLSLLSCKMRMVAWTKCLVNLETFMYKFTVIVVHAYIDS
jgi:hypothetical protein